MPEYFALSEYSLAQIEKKNNPKIDLTGHCGIVLGEVQSFWSSCAEQLH